MKSRHGIAISLWSIAGTYRKFLSSSEAVDESLRQYDAVYNESEATVTSTMDAKFSAFGEWLRGLVHNVDGYVNETGGAMHRGLQGVSEYEEEVAKIVNKTKDRVQMMAAELEDKVAELSREATSEVDELAGRIAEIQDAGALFDTEFFEADEEVIREKNTLARVITETGDENAAKLQKKLNVAAVGGQVEALRRSLTLKDAQVGTLIAETAGNVARISSEQGKIDLLTGEQMTALLSAIEAGMSDKIDAMAESANVNGKQLTTMRGTIGIFTNMVESALDEKTASTW